MLLRMIFPISCLHCGEALQNAKERLCKECLELLTLLELIERCPRCFAELEGKKCIRCYEKGSPLKRTMSAFEDEGAASSLLYAFKTHKREELAKDLAAWMIVQFLKLDSLPDLIVPIPQSWPRQFAAGFDHSLLLANEIGAFLKRPVEKLLKRRWGDFSQRALMKSSREKLSSSSFILKKESSIADKTVLLVDDAINTGATLRACARALEEGFPKTIYGLTFVCKQ